MKYIDHHATDDVVCPRCGHTMEDDGDWHDVPRWTCEECGGMFRINIDYTYTFTTEPIAERALHGEQPREGGSDGTG